MSSPSPPGPLSVLLLPLPGGLSRHVAFLQPIAGVAGRWGAGDF